MSQERPEVVAVNYTAPVSAFVNVKTGEVESVHVWDEEIKGPESRVEHSDYSGAAVSKATAEKAKKIAEQEEWPAWTFGN